MVNTISVRELRLHLSKVLEKIHSKFDRYIVTKRGKPEVIMMSIEDYEGLLETFEIESDPQLVKEIKKARMEFKKGKGIPLEEARKKLGLV